MSSKLIPWIVGGLSGLVVGTASIGIALKEETVKTQPPIVVTIPSMSVIQHQEIPAADEYAGIPDGAWHKLQRGKELFNRRDKSSDAVFSSLLKKYDAYPFVVSESLYYLAATAYRQREPVHWEKALSRLEQIADEFNDTPVFRDGRMQEVVTQAIEWILHYGDNFVEGEKITSTPHYDLALKHIAFFNRLHVSPEQRRRVTIAVESVQNYHSFVLPEELLYNTPLMYPEGGGLDIKAYFLSSCGRGCMSEGWHVNAPYGGMMQAPYDTSTFLCYIPTPAKPEWIRALLHDQLGLTVSDHRASALSGFYSGLIIRDCDHPERIFSYYAARTDNAPATLSVRDLFSRMHMNAFGFSTEER